MDAAGLPTYHPPMIFVTADTSQLARLADQMAAFSPRRMNAAIATALTRTARAARDETRELAGRVLDNPTPFTMRGFFFRGATAARLEARVWFGNEYGEGAAKGRYLTPQIEGGGRRLKRFERALQAAGAMPTGYFAVPGPGAKLDGYGNISRGQLTQILSQVGTTLTAGYSRTLQRRQGESAKAFQSRRRRAFGRSGGQYFAVRDRRGKLKPGVYLAGARDFGAKWGLGRSGGIIPVLLYRPTTTYRTRFDFYGAASRVVQTRMGAELERAVMESAARLAARSVR